MHTTSRNLGVHRYKSPLQTKFLRDLSPTPPLPTRDRRRPLHKKTPTRISSGLGCNCVRHVRYRDGLCYSLMSATRRRTMILLRGEGGWGSRSDNRTTVGDGQSIEQPAATQFLLSRVDKDMRVKPKQETGIIIMPPPR